MTQPCSHADFVKRVLDEFPDLTDEFSSIASLPTLHASVFARRPQRAKGATNWDAYERGIRLVAELWVSADPTLADNRKGVIARVQQSGQLW